MAALPNDARAPKHTYQGYGQQWRNVVMSLVNRGGSVRSFHIDGTTSGTMLPIIRANFQNETFVMKAPRLPSGWRIRHIAMRQCDSETGTGIFSR
jgi:hypothetical protein